MVSLSQDDEFEGSRTYWVQRYATARCRLTGTVAVRDAGRLSARFAQARERLAVSDAIIVANLSPSTDDYSNPLQS